MDAAAYLRKEADRLQLNAETRTAELMAKHDQAQAEIREIEAKAEQTRMAAQRARNCQPWVDGKYYCPDCWISRGERKVLDGSIASPSPDYTLMGCDQCGNWKIPSGRGN